jgi:hypothetical protein
METDNLDTTEIEDSAKWHDEKTKLPERPPGTADFCSAAPESLRQANTV